MHRASLQLKRLGHPPIVLAREDAVRDLDVAGQQRRTRQQSQPQHQAAHTQNRPVSGALDCQKPSGRSVPCAPFFQNSSTVAALGRACRVPSRLTRATHVQQQRGALRQSVGLGKLTMRVLVARAFEVSTARLEVITGHGVGIFLCWPGRAPRSMQQQKTISATQRPIPRFPSIAGYDTPPTRQAKRSGIWRTFPLGSVGAFA